VNAGLIPAGVAAELETLKLRLISTRPEDMPEVDADAMATQISAIRLQLKRLAADRESAQDVEARASES
jgi:hypothetical protein